MVGILAGNKKLRDVINRNVLHYMNAESKNEKGLVITSIIAQIRRESPTGTGFVRQSPQTLRWSYIGLDKAKDKIGHALRKGSQEYLRKRKGVQSSYEPLPHSTSSASLPDSTTATRSMSSSDSDYEEEEGCDRIRRRKDSSPGYHYPASCHGASNPQVGFHTPPGYAYPAPTTQHMMYHHHPYEAMMHHHPIPYPAYPSDPMVASSYHHHYYPEFTHPWTYAHAHGCYDHPPEHNSYGYQPFPQQEPVAYGVPSYPGYSSAPPSKQSDYEVSSGGYARSSSPVPILPKQEYTFTPEEPDSWARSIEEVVLP